MVRAALCLPLERCAQLGPAWRAIACHDARDWRRWPELFERYWHPQRVRGTTRVSGQTRPSRKLQQLVQSLHDSMGSRHAARPAPADSALQAPRRGRRRRPRARAGRRQPHRGAARPLAVAVAAAGPGAARAASPSRSRGGCASGSRAAGTTRPAAAGWTCGARCAPACAPAACRIHPVWRAPRRERPRLFMLVDVSRSMQTHAQLFLRIARAFVTTMDARVFVFHTRLAEVTPLLRSDSAAVQEKVNAVTAGFGGGTRIADQPGRLPRRACARAADARVRVCGCCPTASMPTRPSCLAEQLARVRGRGARIDWFHPSESVPASQAMQAVQAQGGLVERFHRLNSLRTWRRSPITCVEGTVCHEHARHRLHRPRRRCSRPARPTRWSASSARWRRPRRGRATRPWSPPTASCMAGSAAAVRSRR